MSFEYSWSIFTQSLWRTFSTKKVYWEERGAIECSGSWLKPLTI